MDLIVELRTDEEGVDDGGSSMNVRMTSMQGLVNEDEKLRSTELMNK